MVRVWLIFGFREARVSVGVTGVVIIKVMAEPQPYGYEV